MNDKLNELIDDLLYDTKWQERLEECTVSNLVKRTAKKDTKASRSALVDYVTSLQSTMVDMYDAMYNEYMYCPCCTGHIGYENHYHTDDCPLDSIYWIWRERNNNGN